MGPVSTGPFLFTGIMNNRLLLVRLAALCAKGESRELRQLSKTLHSVPRRKIIETLIEVHLFAGFPASIEGFFALGFRTKTSGKRLENNDRANYRNRGIRLSRRVYKRNFGLLLKTMETLNPDLATLIIDYGYGRILSRKGLTLTERELVAIGCLAALGWQRQLFSHIRGGLNVGVKMGDIRRAITIAAKGAALRNGLQTLKKISPG